MPISQSDNTSLKLDVLIVGAGIAGLSVGYCLGKAGHNVKIVEAARVLTDIGAGIQLSPNASRLLIRWGLGEELEKIAVKPESFSIYRYKTGERIGYTLWGESMTRCHNAPYYHAHRADVLKMLHSLAKPFVELRLGCKIASVDPGLPPCVKLSTGEVIMADVIIGADGVKSTIRECLVKDEDKPIHTGDAAYRTVISINKLAEHPDLLELVKAPKAHLWMGPNRHIVGYRIRGEKLFNLVMIHPDHEHQGESWSQKANLREMRETYAGWEPRVIKLLSLVDDAFKSSLYLRNPLKTWVHHRGRVALIGDACHSMLPYRAQGAAMSIEDAAVLGKLFSLPITSLSQIGSLLEAYQAIRHPRATITQVASQANRHVFHLPDGPEQKERDKSMEEAMEAELNMIKNYTHEGNSNVWADKKKNSEQFDYDAEQAADTWIASNPNLSSKTMSKASL